MTTNYQQTLMSGKIILLNGTSSAGKTSIVAALQQLLSEPYLNAGLDKFVGMLPPRYLDLDAPLWQDVFVQTAAQANGRLTPHIHPGPIGSQIVSGMHHTIAALARNGNNIIADHSLYEPHWLAECVHLFSEFSTLFVGILCPLEVAEAREQARQDRMMGSARAMYPFVHAHGLYDLEVDTSQGSVLACAQKIQDHMQHGPPPTALLQLRDHWPATFSHTTQE